MKVVELVVVQIMGTMEDERTFNNMTFYEDKLYNKLCEHLDLVVHMYAQPFYAIYNYPYHIWCNHGLDCKQSKEGMLVWSTLYY